MKFKVKKRNPRAVLNGLPADDYSLPTQEQHDFCLSNYDSFRDSVVLNAANIIIVGFMCQEKVHEKFLRIVNAMVSRFNALI